MRNIITYYQLTGIGTQERFVETICKIYRNVIKYEYKAEYFQHLPSLTKLSKKKKWSQEIP